MKRIIFILCLLISIKAYNQTKTGTSLRLGFDRIGLFIDQTLNFEMNHNKFDIGARYYGPDYVFERNVIGLSLAYGYVFETSGNWFFSPGIDGVFFRELKSGTELYLTNLLLKNRFGYRFNDKLSIFSSTGVGVVINKVINLGLGENYTYPYFNYQLTFGIQYNWKTGTENVD